MPFLSFPKTRLPGLLFAGSVLMAVFGAVPGALAAMTANDGFDPDANGIVNTMVRQPDGKLVIGGYFTQLRPFGAASTAAGYIARVNHDGTVDTSFSPSANDVVRTLVLQPNGQILVGGNFTSMQPSGGGTAQTRGYVARLNTDGSVDTVFNPNANGVVYAVAYQPNGQIVIGGSFTAVQPAGASAATTRNHIARFNADGTLDTTFDPNTDRPVLALAVEPNGQILVGGGFSSFQPNGAASTTARSCMARLNSDGTLDTTFDPEPNGSVSTLLILPTSQIIMGGEFTTVLPNSTTAAIQCDFVARLNNDGTLDGNYIINPLASVSCVAYQPDGKLIIGGTFTQVFPQNNLAAASTQYCVRINNDASVDGSFVPTPNQAVNCIVVEPDRNVVLGGYFTSLQPLDTASSTPRNHIGRVNPYGVPDTTLAPDAAGTVFASASVSGGQTIIGGTFLSISGVSRSYLARLNANGSLDTAFAPTISGPVQAIAIQSDGRILIGGSFTQVDGVVVGNIARLNPDGTVDGTFNPNTDANVTAIAFQSNGQILIGGNFTLLAPNGSTTGYQVSNLARLNTDGSVDLTFNPGPNGSVFAITVQSDGRIIIGGGFTSVGVATRAYIARLLPSGALDTAPFDPEANFPIYSIAVQGDGKILIGGSFTGLFPQTGKIAAPTTSTGPYGTVTLPAPGANATVPIYINHLARLNTDGTLDTSFYPDPDSDVLSIAVQSDGKIVVSGLLTSFAQNGAPTGTIRNYVGRVNADGSLDASFNPDANALVDSVSVLSNGHILVGGSFTTLQPNGASAPTFANHVAILNPDGSIDTSFAADSNSTATGQVSALAQQPNGQFLYGGSFGPLYGSPAPYLSRLNGDASADTSFNSGADGPVNAISVLPNGASTQIPSNSAVWLETTGEVRHAYSASSNGEVVATALQADGKVIIGGLFTNFAGVSGLQNLARLNIDGTVDTSFNPVLSGVVSAIVIQPNGQIVIGGGFTNVDGVNNAYLARLNADGTVDATFAPQPNLQVLALALQADGKILVAGDFTFLVPTGATSASNVNYMARVNTDGTVDSTFNPDFNSPVYTIALLPNAQIVVGGAFTSIDPNIGSTIYSVQYLARLNANGTVDTAFYPDPNTPIVTIVPLASGQILVGGTFSAFEQNANVTNVTPGAIVEINDIARINPDGTVDTAFNPNPNGGLAAIALQPNGQIVIGGGFTLLQPNKTGIPSVRSDIARINPDGTVDPSFDPDLNGTADTVLILGDGSMFVGGNFTTVQVGGAILIGGSFATVGGQPAANLARLNGDGSFDSSFVATTDGPVNVITPLANGSVMIGGTFNKVQGQARPYIASVTAVGTLDPTFNAGVNGTVNVIAKQPNGQFVIGGAFTSVGGESSPYLARVGPTGSPDTSFLPSVNGAVNAVVIQPNGQIVIGGAFTSVGGLPAGHLARLNSNGSVDTTFAPNANGTVQAVTLQVDGGFYVGGSFTTIGGQPIPYAAHLFPDGAVDTGFTPSTNAPVDAILVQPDGKVVLGGSFTSAGGLARIEIARFASPTPVTQSISVSTDQTTVTWTRGGNAPVFSQVGFEETLDGTHWFSLGQATTTDGLTWTLGGAAPSGQSIIQIRATGVIPTSEFGSNGLIQLIELSNTTNGPNITSAASFAGTSGSPLLFRVTAGGSPKTFSASGLPPGLTINSTTGVISGTPTGVGTYAVTLTVGDGTTSTVSTLRISIGSANGTRFASAPDSAANRLLNLSSMSQLSGSQMLIAGFVVSGTAPKMVLLRADGPGLAQFSVSNFMATPELQLFSSTGALMSTSTSWDGDLSATFSQVGAFPLTPGSADAAIAQSLAPGAYTIHVFDPSGKGGRVLSEIYDASASPMTDPERLINISARGTVSPSTPLIGGFVIDGSSTKSVLIRGVGPGLAQFMVTDAIPDPVLSVFDANGNLIAQNFSWSDQAITGADQASVSTPDFIATEDSVGAFELSNDADTALIANLPPGAYTFQISSASKATGEALGEVYELP
jgi:uncharacterized delta-60 repeat protein